MGPGILFGIVQKISCAIILKVQSAYIYLFGEVFWLQAMHQYEHFFKAFLMYDIHRKNNKMILL